MDGGINKMKKILLSLLVMPLVSHAEINPLDPNLKGFQVVKSKTFTKESEFKETHEQDNYLDFFFSFEQKAIKAKTYALARQDVMDTGLKNSSNEIKLSVPFIEPEIVKSKSLGYAPIGTYKDGWTGIKIFFKDEALGICSYSFEKFNYIEAESNYLKNYIHNKPTFTSIEGNKSKGYIYIVSWDINNKDSVYDHKIECANKKNDKEIMDGMIYLANIIDKV